MRDHSVTYYTFNRPVLLCLKQLPSPYQFILLQKYSSWYRVWSIPNSFQTQKSRGESRLKRTIATKSMNSAWTANLLATLGECCQPGETMLSRIGLCSSFLVCLLIWNLHQSIAKYPSHIYLRVFPVCGCIHFYTVFCLKSSGLLWKGIRLGASANSWNDIWKKVI